MTQGRITLMARRRFLPLFVTQFLGSFNDNLYKNAMVILITYVAAAERGLDAKLLVTAAAGVFIFPFLIFSAISGQVADKFQKSRLVVYTKQAELLIMSIAAVALIWQQIELLMVVLFMMGTRSSFFGPLKYSILPEHLDRDELLFGNGLVNAGTFIAVLLGTIVGGLLVLADNGTYWVAGLTLSCSLIGFFASRQIPPTQSTAPDLKVSLNFIREGWRIIGTARGEPGIFPAIIAISWFWLMGATFLAQFPTFAKDILRADETVVTLFLTCFTVGIAVGALLCNKLLRGEVSARLAPKAALGMAVFTLALCAATYLTGEVVETDQLQNAVDFLSHPLHWLVLASLMAIAVSGGVYIVPLYARLQRDSRPEIRARMIAANDILNALFMVLSAVGTLLLQVSGASVVQVFLLLGIANLPVAWLVKRKVAERR